MIAILIMTTTMFVILGSFLPSLVTELRVNNLDNHVKSAHMLAEGGLEDAMWMLNTQTADSQWLRGGWTSANSGATWTKSIDFSKETYQLAGNFQGKVQIVVDNPNAFKQGTQLSIASKGIVSDASGKQIAQKIVSLDVQLRSPFQGIIAKNQLIMKGNPVLNSFDSSLISFPLNPLNDLDSNIVIGSTSHDAKSVVLNQATINGDIVSGAFDPVADGAVSIDLLSKVSGSYQSGFSYSFPDVDTPDTTGWKTSL